MRSTRTDSRKRRGTCSPLLVVGVTLVIGIACTVKYPSVVPSLPDLGFREGDQRTVLVLPLWLQTNDAGANHCIYSREPFVVGAASIGPRRRDLLTPETNATAVQALGFPRSIDHHYVIGAVLLFSDGSVIWLDGWGRRSELRVASEGKYSSAVLHELGDDVRRLRVEYGPLGREPVGLWKLPDGYRTSRLETCRSLEGHETATLSAGEARALRDCASQVIELRWNEADSRRVEEFLRSVEGSVRQ